MWGEMRGVGTCLEEQSPYFLPQLLDECPKLG